MRLIENDRMSPPGATNQRGHQTFSFFRTLGNELTCAANNSVLRDNILLLDHLQELLHFPRLKAHEVQ